MPILLPNSRPANEPWLVYDNRAALQAAGKPGMHAFITGVSEYPNLPGSSEPLTGAGLGMRRPSTTALSAYLILDWLLRADGSNSLAFPVATCRLLLSPNSRELERAGPPVIQGVPPMRELGVPACNLENFTNASDAWRKDAMQRRDDATLFYFAGHGIQITLRNQALLLEGFGGSGPLGRHMVDTLSLRDGMAPFANHDEKPPPTMARPNIARTQFYFVDACRDVPQRMPSLQELRVNSVFDAETADLADDRRAPIFYAALPDGKAQSAPDQQTLFSIALLRCLCGEAARPPDDTDPNKNRYYISSQSLNEGLKRPLDEINQQKKGRQTWVTDGIGEDAVLCYLNAPPSVPISIIVEPATAIQKTSVVVNDMNTSAEVCRFKWPTDDHPFVRKLTAGPYQLSTTVNPPPAQAVPPTNRVIFVEPLRQRSWKVKVE